MKTWLNVIGILLVHFGVVLPGLQWLDPPDPHLQRAWIPLAMMAASAIGSWLSNRKKARTSTSEQSYKDPPEYAGLRDMLIQRAMGRLQQPQGLPTGYAEQGIGEINNVFDVIKQSKANNLTARGLGSSPIAAAVEGRGEDMRGSQIAQFQASLPMLDRQFRDQDFAQAMSVFGQRRPSIFGSQTAAGSALGSGITDMATMMAFLYGQGAFGGGGGKTA